MGEMTSIRLLKEMTTHAKEIKTNKKWIATDGRGRIYTKKKHCKFIRIILSFFNLLSRGRIYRSIRSDRVAAALKGRCEKNQSLLTEGIRDKIFEILDHLHGKAKKQKHKESLQQVRAEVALMLERSSTDSTPKQFSAAVKRCNFDRETVQSLEQNLAVVAQREAGSSSALESSLSPAYREVISENAQKGLGTASLQLASSESQLLQLKQDLLNQGLITSEEASLSNADLVALLNQREEAPEEEPVESAASTAAAVASQSTSVDLAPTIRQMEAGLDELPALQKTVDEAEKAVSAQEDQLGKLTKRTKRARRTLIESRLKNARSEHTKANQVLEVCRARIQEARATLVVTPQGEKLSAELSDAAFLAAIK